jgi:hypothetical protein
MKEKIDSLQIRGIIGCPIFVVNRMKRTVFGIDLTRNRLTDEAEQTTRQVK